MKELIELLKDIRDDIDFENVEDLVRGGYLQSLELLAIIEAIEEKFEVDILPTDIDPNNFDSVESMWNMIEEKIK